MADRFAKLSEFKNGLKDFSAADYDTFEPFSHLIDCAMVNVPHYNCARYKQYAKILLKDAVAKGCNADAVQAEIDKYYVSTVLQEDKSNHIANLVEKVATDEQTKDKGFVIGQDEPITETAYKRTWERIGKKIDLHGATAHVFRHTYITMAAAYLDIKTLQTIAGHSDVSTTMNRYAHSREDKIIAAGQVLSTMYQ